MFVLSNFISAVALCLELGVTVIWWLIIIRVIVSWVNPDPLNPIVQFLYKTTEPFLAPFRRIIPAYNVGIDLSPIFAILVLLFVKYFVVKTLFDLAVKLR